GPFRPRPAKEAFSRRTNHQFTLVVLILVFKPALRLYVLSNTGCVRRIIDSLCIFSFEIVEITFRMIFKLVGELMKKLIFAVVILPVIVLAVCFNTVTAEVIEHENNDKESHHNWVEYSTDTTVLEVGSHEVSYMKNLLRYSYVCDISHKIITVVYYCDEHDHTKSETFLDEVIHSEQHRH
ncbi:hypothetical protein, partial [Oceanobacillus polygoni]